MIKDDPRFGQNDKHSLRGNESKSFSFQMHERTRHKHLRIDWACFTFCISWFSLMCKCGQRHMGQNVHIYLENVYHRIHHKTPGEITILKRVSTSLGLFAALCFWGSQGNRVRQYREGVEVKQKEATWIQSLTFHIVLYSFTANMTKQLH